MIPRGTRQVRRAEAALFSVTVIWGATFVLVKRALEDASTLLFLAVRFSLATVALYILFRRRMRRDPVPRESIRTGLLAGLCLFAAYFLQTAGLRFTTASKSAFLTGLFVVMVPFGGALVYRVWPRPAEAAGVLLATLGMSLMTLDLDTWRMGLGDLLTVGCAAAFACHILLLGHFAPRVCFERVAVLQIGTAAVLALASFGWAEEPYFRPSGPLWLALAVTSLLATALAFTIQAWAQKYTTPTRAALIFAVEPVCAWITAWLAVGERLDARAATGAGLILGGVWLVEFRKRV